MDADADLQRDVAVARDREQAVDEVGGPPGNGERVPAHLVGRRRNVRERRARERRMLERDERAVHDRRPQPVQPRAAVVRARRRERRARELLGVQAIRNALRRIAPHRQRAGQRLGRELVAEARLVRQRGFGLLRLRARPCAAPGDGHAG